ncbi:hypothetical protein BJX99DRAFT_229010 [Aspergillus californicus]
MISFSIEKQRNKDLLDTSTGTLNSCEDFFHRKATERGSAVYIAGGYSNGTAGFAMISSFIEKERNKDLLDNLPPLTKLQWPRT